MIKRAYSILTLKAADEEKRIIEGIATTPTPDRMNDVIVAEGLEFKLPFPLLWQHNSRQPIGNVISAKVTEDGMFIKAQLGASGVAQWLDEAWNLIKAGLVRGLSVGFRALEESYDRETGGYRFLRTEIMELSAVTIPANAECSILTVKSAFGSPAAFGKRRSVSYGYGNQPNLLGVSGVKTNGTNMKTVQEQIAALEAKRAAIVARNEEIRTKSADEGRSMTDEEGQEFDGIEADVATIDRDLTRLRAHEKHLIARATPVKTADPTEPGSSQHVIKVVGPKLPKGIGFARYAMAIAAGKGDLNRAYALANQNKAWGETTPEVLAVLKAAVAAGTTTDATWAAPLVQYQNLTNEFIELLRPLTIIGRIPNLRRVPFNILVPRQTAGSSMSWVGEGGRKPVSKLALDTVTLKWKKGAVIVVLTDELVRFSNPSAEAIVRDDLAKAVAEGLDGRFIDPTQAGTTDISPASILYGADTAAASGATADDLASDLKDAFAVFDAVNLPADGFVIVMGTGQARALAFMRNALDQFEFPGMTATGGTLMGYPVVASQKVPSGVIAIIHAPSVLLADDGTVTIDISREATITMDDGASPAVTTQVSLWERNMVGLRAEQYIDWALARPDAVYYITAANYGA